MTRLRTYITCFLPIIAITISLYITLQTAYRQPLWLDEQYSLLFSQMFSPGQLLMNFTADIHPGLYYLYLKSLLLITQSPFVLRLLSSVVPAYIGLCMLYWYGIRQKSKKYLLLAVSLLMLHPLLINVIWQLRMYGLVVMVICLFYILLDTWQKTQKLGYLQLLSVLLVITVLIDYSLLWLPAATTLLLLFDQRKNLKQWGLGLGVLLLLATLFSSGQIGKDKLNLVGWISTPNLASIASVYGTILGFSQDFFAVHKQLQIGDMLFDGVLVISLITAGRFFWQNRANLNKDSSERNLLLFSIVPMLLLFLFSLVLPILSHLPFFYHFIPGVSLFIPRVQLGFFMLGSLYLTECLVVKKQTKYLLPIGLLIGCIWAVNSYRFNLSQPVEIPTEQLQVEETLLRNHPAILFPSWLYIETLQPDRLSEIPVIAKQIEDAKQVENALSDTQKICSLVKGKNVSTKKFITENLKWETKLIESQLHTCCALTSEMNGFAEWTCPSAH